MGDIRDSIAFMIAKAHQYAQGVLKTNLKSFGLTPMQSLVLESLRYSDGLSVGEVGRRLVLDTATLAGVLDRMVAAGWIRREVDPADARVVRVFLSDEANLISDDLARTLEDTNDQLLEAFSLEEKILLKRFLRDLVRE